MTTYVYTYEDHENDSGPALIDFDLWHGSNLPPVIFGAENEGGSPFPTEGSKFILTIRWPGNFLEKSTDNPNSGFALNKRTSELTWTPTLEENLSIPTGAVAEYEIIRFAGPYQQKFITGIITGKDKFTDV